MSGDTNGQLGRVEAIPRDTKERLGLSHQRQRGEPEARKGRSSTDTQHSRTCACSIQAGRLVDPSRRCASTGHVKVVTAGRSRAGVVPCPLM